MYMGNGPWWLLIRVWRRALIVGVVPTPPALLPSLHIYANLYIIMHPLDPPWPVDNFIRLV